MVVSDHYVDQDGRSWFTVNTPEFDITENLLAQHMLSMDPAHIELYQYFNSIPHLSKPSKTSLLLPSNMEDNIQNMVMDYFEVDCSIGAFDLIETGMISNQKPTMAVLGAILDVLLEERDITNQLDLKNHWILIEKAHDLLLNILYAFGPDMFNGFWDTFDHFHLTTVNEQRHLQYWSISNYSPTNDNSETGDGEPQPEEIPFLGFKDFSDFWAFTLHCFSTTKNLIHAKAYNHALDVLVTLLEQDFYSKKDRRSSVQTTIFLKTLQKNFEGRWDQFDKYIDILLLPFNLSINPDSSPIIITVQKEISGRLMNLLIAISQYEELLPMATIADQTFRKAVGLGTTCLIDLIQYIYFDAFILQLCQCGFIEADWSTVPQDHRHIKREKTTAPEKTSTYLNKWLGAYTKTKPVQITWENIYFHIFLIKQYYHSIVNISTLRYDSDDQGTLITRGFDGVNDEILFILLGDSLVTQFRHQVGEWAKQCEGPSEDWKLRINGILDSLDLELTI